MPHLQSGIYENIDIVATYGFTIRLHLYESICGHFHHQKQCQWIMSLSHFV